MELPEESEGLGLGFTALGLGLGFTALQFSLNPKP